MAFKGKHIQVLTRHEVRCNTFCEIDFKSFHYSVFCSVQNVRKACLYLCKAIVLHDKLYIYFLQNVHIGTSTIGEIRLSIISRRFELAQYNWKFFYFQFNPLRDTSEFRFWAWMKYYCSLIFLCYHWSWKKYLIAYKTWNRWKTAD